MSRGIFLAAGVAVFLIGLVTTCWFISAPHEARRSQEYIQAQVSKHLPKTAHGITAQDAVVKLDHDHVVILAEITGTRLTKSFSMVVEAIGIPDYQNSRNGEFFFQPEHIAISDFHLDDSKPHGLLNRMPERYKEKVEDWMAHSAERGAKLVLERVPVYRLKDDNLGWVVRSSLQNVSIDGNELVITYSVWALTKIVLVGILAVLGSIAFVGALIACPEMLLFLPFM